ncbi:hypothetical protein Cni_G10615 [Canna indica]|uniref:Uncharacterized protein n=1 Tax=Canna indica TaxID=4628 RepID=A0AAQ3Q7H1_9LILI|nr:hypothetical protein Cni_G10615 [Canna indica]
MRVNGYGFNGPSGLDSAFLEIVGSGRSRGGFAVCLCSTSMCVRLSGVSFGVGVGCRRELVASLVFAAGDRRFEVYISLSLSLCDSSRLPFSPLFGAGWEENFLDEAIRIELRTPSPSSSPSIFLLCGVLE